MKFIISSSAVAAVAVAMPQEAIERQLRSVELSNAPGTSAAIFGIGGGYGCWCYFGDDHLERKAKGPPLDQLDEFCHTLSRGYECATIDIDGCTPWDIDYQTDDDISTVGATPGDLAAMCFLENGNANSCEYAACTTEGWFLRQISDITGGMPAMIDQQNKHNDADWETRRLAMCVGPAVGTDRQIECCGTFPERFPYNSLAPNKQCCEDTTVSGTVANPIQSYVFNTAFEECCPDGAIIEFGQSC